MNYNTVMTETLYYQDTAIEEFEAEIVEIAEEKKGFAVILNRTYFYPEGGGQPADKGWIAGIPVTDVQKKDGVIRHYLPQSPETGIVCCKLDTAWRRHFMQQHTGQHIISAALFTVAGYKTVSVHMGTDITTVELEAPAVPGEDILEAETMANRIIARNLPIDIVNTRHTELAEHGLRRPCLLEGDVRLGKIPDFDCVACGGLHLATTGPVRMVKFAGQEKIRGHVRLAWRIGDRAFQDYTEKSDILSQLRPLLDSREEEFVARVMGWQEDMANLKSRTNQLEQRLAEFIASQSLIEASGADATGLRVVARSFDEENPELLKKILKLVTQEPRVVVCLVNRIDGKLQWSIGSSDEISIPLQAVKERLLPLIDGKGGGRPPLYQGTGLDPAGLDRFLAQFTALVSDLNL